MRERRLICGRAKQLMVAAVSAVPLVAMVAEPAMAIVYWDTNGAAGGAGATPNGTWDLATANWNTVSSGIGATGVYGADTTARFSAGTDAVNPFTVTVDGTVNVTQLQIEEAGVPTFTGGTLNFIHASGNAINTGANATTGSSAIINSKVSGSVLFQISRSGTTTGNVITFGNTANDFTGGLRVNADNTVKLGAAGVIPDANSVDLRTNAVFDLNGFDETIAGMAANNANCVIAVGANTLTLASPAGEQYLGSLTASSGGRIIKNGTGTMTLSGNNTSFLGEWVVNDGTIIVANQNGFGNNVGAQLTLNGGKLTNSQVNGRTFSANLQINLGANPAYDNSGGTGPFTFAGPVVIKSATSNVNIGTGALLTVSGVLSDEGAGRNLTKSGDGTLALTNSANTYSGTTTVSAGTLQINSDATIGNAAGTLDLAGGTLNTTASRGVVAAPVANPLTVSANSSITTSSAAAEVELNLSSSTVGGAGTLTLQNNGADAPTDVFQPRFTGSGANFNPGPIDIQNGAVGLTLLQSYNPLGTTQTFANLISGNGSYKRNASSSNNGGDSIFTAANTYSGGAAVGDGGIGFGIDSVAGVSGPVGTGTLTISPNLDTSVPRLFASGAARTVSNPMVWSSSNAGALTFSGSENLTMSGTLDLGAANRSINVTNTAATELSGVISNGGLTKTGPGTLTLSGNNTYAGGNTVTGGTLVSTNGFKNGGAMSITDADAVVPASSPDGFDPGNNIFPSGTNAAGSLVTSLAIAGTGQLDLNNNDMVIDHDGSLDIADIRDLIASGYNFGGQDGPGIISSTAANTDPFTFTLGYADNASLPLPYGTTIGLGTLFAGFDVDDTAALIKFTWVGDVTLDGIFDFQDLSIFNGNYDAGATTGRVWTDGDLNFDGTIDFQDLSLFNGNYDPSKPSLPEPASMLMLASGVIALLSRRRRRVQVGKIL